MAGSHAVTRETSQDTRAKKKRGDPKTAIASSEGPESNLKARLPEAGLPVGLQALCFAHGLQ